MQPPTPHLRPVPTGPARDAAQVLRSVWNAILASPLVDQLDLEASGECHPVRGRSVALALQFKDGDTWYLDAARGETD